MDVFMKLLVLSLLSVSVLAGCGSTPEKSSPTKSSVVFKTQNLHATRLQSNLRIAKNREYELKRARYQARYKNQNPNSLAHRFKVVDKRCRRVSTQEIQNRMRRHMPAIQKAARKHGVSSKLLLAVTYAESCLNPYAKSRAGARGMMQLMPGTAKMMKVKNSYNAYENIDGGAKYLKRMLKRFNNNIPLALAGYNAGPGNVTKYGGIPPFKETQSYVIGIMKRLRS